MKYPWLAGPGVVIACAAIGVALAGAPSSVDNTVITPAPITVSTVAEATTTSAASTVPESPDTTSTSTSTSTTVLDIAAVRILVANGGGRNGIADAASQVLIGAGFSGALAVDALERSATTVIHARAGFEPVAAAVAEELGLSPAIVVAFGTDPITDDDEAADVIVVLGGDYTP